MSVYIYISKWYLDKKMQNQGLKFSRRVDQTQADDPILFQLPDGCFPDQKSQVPAEF